MKTAGLWVPGNGRAENQYRFNTTNFITFLRQQTTLKRKIESNIWTIIGDIRERRFE